MKKIILAFDENHFSEGAFEFARRLNEFQPVLLIGIFLTQAMMDSIWSFADGGGGTYITVGNFESEELEKNIKRFEKLCQHNDIDYRVHNNVLDRSLPELAKESIYADLVIIGSDMFYKNMDTDAPNEFLQNAMHNIKCPAFLVPEKFDFPESIILAYDGSEESVFAIKQFAYLFPELTNRETLLVYANENLEEDFPDKIQIEELAARHFNNLTLFKLGINPKKYFSTWISEKKSAALVSGSYGRSGLSQLFKRSFVKNVIAEHLLPVFIAHK